MELLSARYGIPVCMIVRANRKAFLSGIRSGLAVKIPPRDYCSARLRSHVVASGETVFSISQKYGVTMQAILKSNGIGHPSALREGISLSIPPCSRIYTVGATDTLNDVARKTGVPAGELSKANGDIKSVYRGMQLIIPE